MAPIELNQAKTAVDEIFRSALGGEDVIITEHNEPVLKITRIESSNFGSDELNALDRLQRIRISASPDFSQTAELYSPNGNNK